MTDDFTIEVVYAQPEQQELISLSYSQPVTVEQAIHDSGILQIFPDINLSQVQVGIYGQKCTFNTILKANDRVEIYRALQQNPMDARRNRAVAYVKGR